MRSVVLNFRPIFAIALLITTASPANPFSSALRVCVRWDKQISAQRVLTESIPHHSYNTSEPPEHAFTPRPRRAGSASNAIFNGSGVGRKTVARGGILASIPPHEGGGLDGQFSDDSRTNPCSDAEDEPFFSGSQTIRPHRFGLIELDHSGGAPRLAARLQHKPIFRG